MSNNLPQRMARACAHWPRLVLGLWLTAVVASVGINWWLLDSAVTSEVKFISDPDSKVGRELLETSSLADNSFTEVVTVAHPSLDVHDPRFRAHVEGLTRELDNVPAFLAINYYDTGVERLIGRSGKVTLIPLAVPLQYSDDVSMTLAIVEAANGRDGFTLTHSGEYTVSHDMDKQSKQDLLVGETIGAGVGLLILLLVFGSVIAGVMPVVLAGTSIVIGLGIVSLIGQLAQFSYFVVNLMAMMGLAVGIDYSLLIVTRYREERARGSSHMRAIEAAGATAGKAVLFSGLTVVIALAGLLLVPNTIFVGLGSGAIIVVMVTVLQALTLVPALLCLFGHQLDRFQLSFVPKPQARDSVGTGVFASFARAVMKRPAVSLVATSALLLLAAAPAVHITTGFSGASTLPDGLASKAGLEVLEREFDIGEASPAQVIIDGDPNAPEVEAAAAALQEFMRQDGGFGTPGALEASFEGDMGLLQTPLTDDPRSQDAYDTIIRLRAALPDLFREANVPVYVAGQSAADVDFIEQLDSYTPSIIGLVLLLSAILLTLAFRSLVIAATSIMVTLVSVLAAYGVLVLVMQLGVGNEIFGFKQVEWIEPWLPLFLFALLFGLSMDYQIFLVSRIQERFVQKGDNAEAVLFGVANTARLITGAAAIMIAVFAGFAAGQLVALAELGFGLAVAITIDAFIVRTLLVPAAMTLLGSWNWYVPTWLAWLPEMDVEGSFVPKEVEGSA